MPEFASSLDRVVYHAADLVAFALISNEGDVTRAVAHLEGARRRMNADDEQAHVITLAQTAIIQAEVDVKALPDV